MTDIIQLLPDSVANQIAAGEVIQRPASVVKELVENALDAGASKIQLILKDAGRTLVQVIDNGKGMSPTDARMAFERHATSKIREAADLFAIRTMGFRGEALASIASVAEVELKTRRETDELGTLLVIAASEVVQQESIACNVGTSFAVKNLFYNVPARRKFLKSNATELKNIINEMERVALANPEIAFSVNNNGIQLYDLPSENRRKRISSLFGKNMNQALIPIELDTTMAKISGYVGLPKFARRTFGEQFFFVNNRFMKHPYFHRGVLQAYDRILSKELIPQYFIFFEVDPANIDINIHPTKTEIKFESENGIWQLLHAAVREALGKSNVVPSIDFDQEGSIDIPLPPRHFEGLDIPSVELNPNYNPFETLDEEDDESTNLSGAASYQSRTSGGGSGFNFRSQGFDRADREPSAQGWEQLYGAATFEKIESAPEQNPVWNMGAAPTDQLSQTNLLEQAAQQGRNFIILKNKYILTPVKSGLMVIDQRRAHQRILYERFCSQLKSNQCVSQQLLFPQTIDVKQSEAVEMRALLPDLNAIGFDISEFGPQTFVINGIPALLSHSDPKAVIEFLLEQHRTTAGSIPEQALEQLAESLARSSAIGTGHQLSQQEAGDLIDSLFACQTPNFSPSGKPIIEIMAMEELEKRMK